MPTSYEVRVYMDGSRWAKRRFRRLDRAFGYVEYLKHSDSPPPVVVTAPAETCGAIWEEDA